MTREFRETKKTSEQRAFSIEAERKGSFLTARSQTLLNAPGTTRRLSSGHKP